MSKFLIILLTTYLCACTIVRPGEIGVRYFMGKLSNDTLSQGTNLWIPYFMGASRIDVQIRSFELKTSSGTKDQQEVTTTATVNLQLQADKVLDTVKQFGDEEVLFNRIMPLIQEAINGNISKYSAEEVLTKRSELKLGIENNIRSALQKYGLLVHDVSIKDLQYAQEYSDAIEKKQVAEQRAKQAEYETQRLTQEAKGAIEKARGDAEAQRLLRASLTTELLQLKAIEKWNGTVPQIMGSGSNMLFNIPTGTTKKFNEGDR